MAEVRGDASVAVIVPVFNRLELLKATVDSLRAQTLATAEFILVDDRSDEPVRHYLETLPEIDRRFRVLRKPDAYPRGCQESRNIGIDAATAEAVMFLDSDDLVTPECLEQRYSLLCSDPRADIVVGRQAGFTETMTSVHWINVPSSEADLDRFLHLTQPLDVPWINGGVIIRTTSLRGAGARWRPEFHWDDVAFHFECLVSGMSAKWMTFDGPPDSFYRRHGGERYGRALFTPDGMRSSARMLAWMFERLKAAGLATESRRRALVVDFFHACVLRAIDSGHDRFAEELIAEARGGSVVTSSELSRFRVYLDGRRRLHRWPRLTYYWNRFAQRWLLTPLFSARPSTYSSVVPDSPVNPIALQSGAALAPGTAG